MEQLGGTQFYIKDTEEIKEVLSIPGRILVFSGDVLHRATALRAKVLRANVLGAKVLRLLLRVQLLKADTPDPIFAKPNSTSVEQMPRIMINRKQKTTKQIPALKTHAKKRG